MKFDDLKLDMTNWAPLKAKSTDWRQEKCAFETGFQLVPQSPDKVQYWHQTTPKTFTVWPNIGKRIQQRESGTWPDETPKAISVLLLFECEKVAFKKFQAQFFKILTKPL